MIEVVLKIVRRLYNAMNSFISSVIYFFVRNQKLNIKFDSTVIESKWLKKDIHCITNELLGSPEIDLSIIIPLYNSEPYIDKCLSSFLNQKTNYKYEIILVNDGSIDRTAEIINVYSLRYPKLVKVYSQENAGISAARNTGIMKSKGKYIGFVDHDDWVNEEYIEKLLTCAYKENADIVKCEYASVKSGVIRYKEIRPQMTIKGNMKEKLFEYPSFIWGGVYRRELIEKVRFPKGFWYEDMITRMLLFRQSKCFVDVGETLYYKRIHADNASTKVWNDNDYKCLEQLYLPEILYNDSVTLLGAESADVYAYLCILLEYSAILYHRIKNLPENIREQAFLYAVNRLEGIYKPEYENSMSLKQKRYNKALIERHYKAWKVLSWIR